MKRMRQKGISRERRMLRDFDFHICCHKNEKLYFTVPHRKVSRKKISSMHSFLKRGSIDAPWTPARDLGSVIHRHCHCLLRLWFGNYFVVLVSGKHNSNSTRKKVMAMKTLNRSFMRSATAMATMGQRRSLFEVGSTIPLKYLNGNSFFLK
jgi:hypothetical protein